MKKQKCNAAWLSWMPKTYSNTVVFLLEARAKGIILPVTLIELEDLSWNDDIYCIQTRKPNKHGSVFCRIPIARLYGITRGSAERIRAEFPSVEKDPGGDFVQRGGKDYMEGGTWSTSGSMQDIAQLLSEFWKESPEDKSAFGIGCYKDQWETLPLPWPRLLNVKRDSGFRSFDAKLFDFHAEQAKTYGLHVTELVGEYHDPDSCRSFDWPGDVQWAEDYRDLPARIAKQQLELFT